MRREVRRIEIMKASAAASTPTAHVQVAALSVRIDDNVKTQVLLLTSRERKRWVIPKGWPMKGRKPWEAAAQEALEEAGVVGRAGKTPVGKYTYFKRQEAHFDVCDVDVYLLTFARQLKTWREMGQREIKWFEFGEAAELVEEPGLIALLRDLDHKGLDKLKLK